jgi:hypothetical protein
MDRAPSQEWNEFDRRTATAHAAERPASLAARGRFRVVQWLRAVPIRWRILSIAALNSAVVVVLAVLIWNGSKVLGSAWDDVRQVRESDKILALLESETSRLQNLIHRYINQPSPELFAEILLLREAVLGTLTTRAANDPMLSGSVERLERVTDRFLNGFGELRAVQATITKTYEQQVLGPARKWPGCIRSSRAPPASRRADLAGARKIPRSVYGDAGRRQRLLPVARVFHRRGRPQEYGDDREDHPRDGRSRRQRSATHGAEAAGGADGGAARGHGQADGAARNPDRALAQHHRRPARPRPSALSTNCRSRCASASTRRRRRSTARWRASRAGCCRSP